MALKNVHYRLFARIVPKPAFSNESGKFNACFQRRARSGKCFQQPYFGCREFPAFFEYIEAPESQPVMRAPYSQHLGFMLYDVFDLSKDLVREKDGPFITVFPAQVHDGVLEVPPFGDDTVKKPRRSGHVA
jgi:CRISPR-associated protein Cas5d